MKQKLRTVLYCGKEYFKIFFFSFGILELLVTIRNSTPYYGNMGHINVYDTKFMLMLSALSALAYLLVRVEVLEQPFIMKIRRVLFFLCIAGACLMFAWEFGIRSWVYISTEGMSKQAAGLVQIALWVLSAVLVLLPILFLEKHYRKVGKKYTTALEQYKEKCK